MDVSVVIVSWNTRALLEGCLRAVFDGMEGLGGEVVVVDNGSSDGSVEMVERAFSEVRLIRNVRNVGFGAANNQGIRASRGRFVLLLNSDTEVTPGAIWAMMAYLDAHREVGMVGPKLVGPEGRLQLSCGVRPTIKTELFNKMLLHVLFPFYKLGRWDHRTTREVGWVTGACMMVRRAMVEEIGAFDEHIVMCYEDLEWCLRAEKAGWRIVYLPEARVVHWGGRSVQQCFGEMLVASQRSAFYLFGKHYGAAELGALRALTLLEMVLRSVLWMGFYVFRAKLREESKVRLGAYRTIFRRSLWDRTYWCAGDW